jgi:Peptidase family M13
MSAALLQAQGPLNLQNLDLDAIDKSCQPCDDFYQFAIGKWNADHPIPENQVRWGKRWAGADANLDVLNSRRSTASVPVRSHPRWLALLRSKPLVISSGKSSNSTARRP